MSPYITLEQWRALIEVVDAGGYRLLIRLCLESISTLARIPTIGNLVIPQYQRYRPRLRKVHHQANLRFTAIAAKPTKPWYCPAANGHLTTCAEAAPR